MINSLDMLLPDPDLVERFRQGIHAHNARNRVRDRLLRQAMAADDAIEDVPRVAHPGVRLAPVPAHAMNLEA